MIKNIDILADRLKGIKVNGKDITAEELKTFISSEDEMELSVPKFNVLSDTELEQVKDTVKEGSKNTGFVDGMKAGAERLVKSFRNAKELDFEGKLKYDNDGKIDFDATAEHVSSFYDDKILSDAKVEPDKKIQELQESLKKVQKTYDTEKLGWDNDRKTFDNKIKALHQDNFLQSNLPEVDGLNKKQLVALYKLEGFGVDFDENGTAFPTKNGNKVLDNMEKPVSFENNVSSWLEKTKWNDKPVGRGVKDVKPEATPAFKSKNEAYAHMESNKIDPESQKGQDILSKIGQE